MPRKGFAGNAVITTISSGIASSGTTTFTIASATGWTFTTTPFVVVVDRGLPAEEKILCSAIAGTTITIQTRGYDGTTSVAHSVPAQCIHVYDSIEAESSNAHVFDATRHDHTQYARLAAAANFTAGLQSGGQAVVVTTDSRLSDARTPSNDADIVHKSGSETISGVKTFSAAAALAASSTMGGSVLVTTNDSRLSDNRNANMATPTVSLGSTAAAGGLVTAIRSDATIAAFDTTAPPPLALATTTSLVGTINFAARRDHNHGVSGQLPIANGGTGSATRNFVDLSSNETIGGTKTFALAAALASGTTVGGSAVVTTNDTRLVSASNAEVMAWVGVNT